MRKTTKTCFGLMVVSTLLPGTGNTLMAQPVRPNIVYIMTDQQSAYAMSCAGNDDLSTPAMDRLSREGVMFTRAYCAFPLCTPSRAGMLTGKMPHELGIKGNNQALPAEVMKNELGNILSRAGYECVYGGKLHLGPTIDMPAQNDFGFRRICGFNDNVLADSCAEFFSEHDERTPFFLVASFDNPHNICEWARNEVLPWGSVDDNTRIGDCPNLPANYAIPAFEPDVIRKVQKQELRTYPVTGYSGEDWRRYRNAYYRLTEKVDREIGKILEALDRQGLTDNTLIIFSSDHGDGNAAHHWNQKSILYEECIRVPFIVKPPGSSGLRGIADSTHLVSNGLDLLPTICDYAGARIPAGLNGRSLRPVIERENIPWRDTLFVETAFNSGTSTSARAAITLGHKYIVYSWGKYREQLFDLIHDKGELVNLAVESEYDELKDSFRKTLYNWSLETRYNYFNHYSHPGNSIDGPGYEFKAEY